MLDFVRKKQKSMLIKIAFAVIILSFVIGYAMLTAPGDTGGDNPSAAATVNGTTIGYNEFQSAYSNLYRLYQDIYREQFTPAMEKQLGLRRQALDALIDQSLLLQEAEKLGLDVDRQELVKAISEIPAFHENGAFSRDRYLQALSSQRLNPESFEEMQRRQLLVEKVQSRIEQEVEVTEEELDQEYRNRTEKVNLSFLRLSPSLFEKQVRPDQAGLEAYFAEHREEFRRPEQVALDYLQFDPDRYREDVVFEDGELEQWYRRHLERFDIPEQVKASHILIKVAENAGEEMRRQKRDLAEKLLAEARADQDFHQLARKHSDDPGSAAKGGDLGFFTRGTMVAPFEQAAFSLQPGQISDLVESPFGFHIIRVEERIEAGVKPLAEVMPEVEAGLRADKARQIAFEKAMDAYNIHRQAGDLRAAAEKNDLELRRTELFARQEGLPAFSQDPEITASAFALNQGELSRPVNLPDAVVLFSVRERQESRLPELDEVRDEVESRYRQHLAREKTRETAAEILAALKDGKSLKALAREFGAEVEETGMFSRANGAFIPRLGTLAELSEAAFTLTAEAPVADAVFEQDDTFVIAALKERLDADFDELTQTARDQLREDLLAQQKNEAVRDRLQELRNEAKITIAPSIASSLEGENS